MANSLIQKNAAASSPVSSFALQYTTQNVTTGSLLAAWIPLSVSGASGITLAVSDDQNGPNTPWTQAGTYLANGANRNGSWWYFANSVGGVKPTVTAVQTGGPANIGIMIYEFGVTTPSGVTVASTATNTGSNSTPAVTATVSGSGKLVVAGCQGSAVSSTGVSGGSFTFDNAVVLNLKGATASDVNVSANDTATFTPSESGIWLAMAVVFNTAGASGPPKFTPERLAFSPLSPLSPLGASHV